VSVSRKGRVVETPRIASRHWTNEVAWYALLGALVLSLVVTDPTGLYSGMYFTKDLIVRLLVSVGLVFWGASLLSGHAAIRWHPVAWVTVGYLAWPVSPSRSRTAPEPRSSVPRWARRDGCR